MAFPRFGPGASRTYGFARSPYPHGALLRNRNIFKDPAKGLYATEEWFGNEAQVAVLAALADDQSTFAIDGSAGPLYKFTYQTPDDLDVQTTWEVDGNDSAVSVYSNQKVIGKVGIANIKLAREWFKGPENAAEPIWVGSTDQKASAALLYQELLKDQTHDFESSYVLRKRQVGTNQGFPSAFMDLDAIGLVFTSAQLLPGGAFDYGMPLAIQDFIRDIPDRAATNYTWGWLFKTPKITGIPGGKFELKEEFYLYLWSNLRFDAAS